MGDEVIPENGLDTGETMRVMERAVELDSGVVVWLRRWVDGDRPGTRAWLADGRWCATRADVGRLYAVPASAGAGGKGHEWAYRTPTSYATWQDALVAARDAERADARLGRVASAMRAGAA